MRIPTAAPTPTERLHDPSGERPAPASVAGGVSVILLESLLMDVRVRVRPAVMLVLVAGRAFMGVLVARRSEKMRWSVCMCIRRAACPDGHWALTPC